MAAVVVQANSNTHEALSFFLIKMGWAGLVARVAEAGRLFLFQGDQAGVFLRIAEVRIPYVLNSGGRVSGWRGLFEDSFCEAANESSSTAKPLKA
ncbi:MAG: hypothetical protein OJF52_004486 [Nitrospira sp.]|nr:MAG: hypothetical protein OJF52_004486 [Nitrospira sp.]